LNTVFRTVCSRCICHPRVLNSWNYRGWYFISHSSDNRWSPWYILIICCLNYNGRDGHITTGSRVCASRGIRKDFKAHQKVNRLRVDVAGIEVPKYLRRIHRKSVRRDDEWNTVYTSWHYILYKYALKIM